MRRLWWMFLGMAALSLATACVSMKSQDDYTKDVLEDIFGPPDTDPTPPPAIDVTGWDHRDFACTGSGGAQVVTFYQSPDGLTGVVSPFPSTLLAATNTGRYEGRTSDAEGNAGLTFHFFRNGNALFDAGFQNSTCKLVRTG